MPEDYQSLFGELGGVQEPEVDPVADPVDPLPTDPIEQDPVDPNTTLAVDPVDTEPAADPADTEGELPQTQEPNEVSPSVKAANEAFAAMRAQNAKYQKAFAQITKAMGAENEDEVIENLIGASFNVQAKRENVDPAVLRRITDLEEKNMILDTATREQFVKDSFGAVQKKFSLSDQEVMSFAKKLTDQKVDIFNSNIPLDVLYQGMFHETMSKKLIETEKQNWIKGQTEAEKAPGVIPATGKQLNKETKNITTEADLNLVLKNFGN